MPGRFFLSTMSLNLPVRILWLYISRYELWLYQVLGRDTAYDPRLWIGVRTIQELRICATNQFEIACVIRK